MNERNCTQTVCIPQTRYEDLIHTEEKLFILLDAYQRMDKYDLEKVMDAVFPSAKKYREDAGE